MRPGPCQVFHSCGFGKQYAAGLLPVSMFLRGQVELHERRGDSIPEGWGCDAQGKLTPDPKKVLSGGGLVPIGGSEATGQKPTDEFLCTLLLTTIMLKQSDAIFPHNVCNY